MNLYFEPNAIRLHYQMVDVFGKPPRSLETAPAELEGVLSAVDGLRGSVTIPLDAAESQFLREIIASASKRAIDLVRDSVAVP